jgi:hypothetical protein
MVEQVELERHQALTEHLQQELAVEVVAQVHKQEDLDQVVVEQVVQVVEVLELKDHHQEVLEQLTLAVELEDLVMQEVMELVQMVVVV